jgi:2-oxoglutarate ferredoxin oxidoreductase subunit alpha
MRAIHLARAQGLKVGFVRLITAWPFPVQHFRDLAHKVKTFVMVELNLGQMVYELERSVAGKAEVLLVPHAGGWVHNPDDILKTLVEAAK